MSIKQFHTDQNRTNAFIGRVPDCHSYILYCNSNLKNRYKNIIKSPV